MERLLVDSYALLPPNAYNSKPALDVDPASASIHPTSAYLTPPHSTLDLSPTTSAIPVPSLVVDPPSLPNTEISISTQFYPGAVLRQDLTDVPQDLVLQSADGVFFYVHSILCRIKSTNAFGGLLLPVPVSTTAAALSAPPPADPAIAVASAFIKTPFLTPASSGNASVASSSSTAAAATSKDPSTSSSNSTPPDSPTSSRASLPGPRTPPPQQRTPAGSSSSPLMPNVFAVPEPAAVLNLVLHVIYGIPFSRYSPDLDTLSRTVPVMRAYGLLNPSELTHSELFSALLAYAPSRPLQVYTLAAQYKWHDLAVLASQHTLSVNLSTVTDQQSVEMGPLYLKWLFFLHLGRAEALKRILVQPLDVHPLGLAECSADDQTALSRAWGLTTAYILSTENVQNVSVGMLNSTYGSLFDSVRCRMCKERLRAQVALLVGEWSKVQNTI